MLESQDFGREQEAHDAFFKAFEYMVAKLEPQEWDIQIVNLVHCELNNLVFLISKERSNEKATH